MNSDNVAKTRRWDDVEKRFIHEITLQQAAKSLTPEEIRDVVSLIRRREEAQTLEEIANLSTVSFRLLAEKVRNFSQLPVVQSHLPTQETVGVRVALIRHFISDQLEFIGVAKRHLRIRDFTYLIDRVIGDDSGMGRIGGKAAGMLLAHRILERARKRDRQAPQTSIVIPESFFLRSDVIERFLEINGLVELQSHKYKSLEEIRNEYSLLVEMFKNGEFPEPEKSQLRSFLQGVGQHPLIVRSSSLLEDRFGTAFAGKYRSVFVANQGTLEENLVELLGAITEVYASLLHPDPISYRQRHSLLDYDENMAVLIQKVVGTRYRHYFCPLWAGVAFSRNEYRWSTRIKRDDGLARIVFGLGTRAVDRVSSDYPRMLALGLPTLRPEASTEEIVRYSQRFVDVINLKKNRFETIPLSDMVTSEPLAGLDKVVEVLQDGELVRPLGSRIAASPSQFVITFDRFAKESPYPGVLKWVLQSLEKAYECPVDVEFAYDGNSFYLLQCRPQVWREEDLKVTIPFGIDADRRVFSAHRNITTGSIHGIEYIVLVDPRDYDQIDTTARRQQVARVVNALNSRLAERRFVLMGPGRWGSADVLLGIPIGYSGINNTKMLVEIARTKGDHVPEVSFGTHFFQDLVESDIKYLAVYPEMPQSDFHEQFLHQTPNVLAELVPEFADFQDVVRVINVRASSGGMLLNVDMDGENQVALAYLCEA